MPLAMQYLSLDTVTLMSVMSVCNDHHVCNKTPSGASCCTVSVTTGSVTYISVIKQAANASSCAVSLTTDNVTLMSVMSVCNDHHQNIMWRLLLHCVCHYRVCDMHVCQNQTAADSSSCAVTLTWHCDTHVCNDHHQNIMWRLLLHWVCHYRVCDMLVCQNQTATDSSSCAVTLTRHCDTHVCNVCL